jgi:hypothetical protein
MSDRFWRTNWPETRRHLEGWWRGEDLVLGAWGTGLVADVVHDPASEPPPTPTSVEQRHTDPEYIARNTRYRMARRVWPAEILPAAWPHIGTLPLAVYLGATPHFSEQNIWYSPCMADLEDHPPLALDPDAPQCRQLEAIVRETVRLAGGNYLLGMPAILPGMDILAELRGTGELMMDMIENPEGVHRRLAEIDQAYTTAFDRMYEVIRADDGSMAFGYFMLWGTGRTGLCQCDTAAMFSPAMFEQFVIPSLRRQCGFLDQSMFHVDGSQCLHHMPLLLEVEELDAIEYTPDPRAPGGGDPAWYDLYRRILAAGKSVWVANLRKQEVVPLLDAIGGRGVYLSVNHLTPADAEELAVLVEPYRNRR